jgi:hypothetical protein
MWAGIGALGTYADKIHEIAGVSAYPNAEWIGERFWFSPVYTFAGLAFFALYRLTVGRQVRAEGLFGGGRRTPRQVAHAFSEVVLAYVLTGLLAGHEVGRSWLPYVASIILAAWAAPTLWSTRRTGLWAYALLVAVSGSAFEWTATSQGGFTYPACPSAACLGTTVPLIWLPLLYVHAALFFHRLARGPRLVLHRAPSESAQLA